VDYQLFYSMVIDIHGWIIGLPDAYVNINAHKIGGGFDIKGPKIGGPGLDIHGPKLDVELDIHWPQIGLHNIDVPNIDVDINVPKIRGGLDIHGSKIGGSELDIHDPNLMLD